MLKLPVKEEGLEFTKKIESISEQNVFACYQCGKCSAGCPMVSNMDLLPNQVIRLIQFGDERVLESKTIWICATCYTCSIRCPKGIDIARVMEALRITALRKHKVDFLKYKELPVEDLKNMPQIALVSASRKYTVW
ncbi:MAG: 4Fe-4S dicluster domain-containing protein [Candidatus Asgardarchaeia archaeon]